MNKDAEDLAYRIVTAGGDDEDACNLADLMAGRLPPWEIVDGVLRSNLTNELGRRIEFSISPVQDGGINIRAVGLTSTCDHTWTEREFMCLTELTGAYRMHMVNEELRAMANRNRAAGNADEMPGLETCGDEVPGLEDVDP